MLKLYNTLSRQKEVFKPIKDKKVGMYVCGPTVYDSGHLGHARTYIIFDVIRKYLEESGYKVNFVSNITDVHDDIIRKANAENATIKEISDKYTKEFFKELKELKIKPADEYPRVSEYIPQIIEFIEQLTGKGFAYEKNGSVYFDVSKFKDYGKLSRRKLEQAKSGTRVNLDKYEKEEAADFALWKKSDNEDKKAEASWDSPWGQGRPGWHIECSVMSKDLLGEQFDIHAGARDLAFPHHENEIAQSEASSGKSPFVKYWLHSGLLTVNKQKMSKSLGNFITIRNIFKKNYNINTIRLWVLKSHYRSPLNFSKKALTQASIEEMRINSFLSALAPEAIKPNKSAKELDDSIRQALDDDFNTPKAIAVIWKSIRQTWKLINQGRINDDDAIGIYNTLHKWCFEIFGISSKVETRKPIPQEIEKLVEKREQARQDKDWLKADQIRKQVEKKEYQIEDTDKGPKISPKY